MSRLLSLTVRMNNTTLHSTPYGATAWTMWIVASSYGCVMSRLTEATRVILILWVLCASVVVKVATWVRISSPCWSATRKPPVGRRKRRRNDRSGVASA